MPAIEALLPDDYGQVYVSSPEHIRCVITTGEVCAQYDVFTESPLVEGGQANGVRISPAGQLTWVLGDLGGIPAIDLDATYDYTALGWTISARGGAVHLTNSAGADVTITTSGVQTRA